jgi:hypothetical protein
VWAIANGISGIFAAIILREAGERVERMLDRHRRTPALRDREPNSK